MPSKWGARIAARLTPLAHPKCDLEALARSHPINSSCQLLLPLTAAEQPEQHAHAKQHHYTVATVRLGDLVAELVAHNQQSPPLTEFQAVALGPSLDRHGGIAISPDCVLHMAVSRDMYQQLGLPGSTSPTHPGERYNIEIKLDAKGFRAGRAFHDRVVDCLNTRMGLCTLAMAWSSQPIAAALTDPQHTEANQGAGGAGSAQDSMQEADADTGGDGSEQVAHPSSSSSEHEHANASASSHRAAPSHGLRSVLRAQGRCCVCAVKHQQWEMGNVCVPVLDRRVFTVQSSGSGGDKNDGADRQAFAEQGEGHCEVSGAVKRSGGGFEESGVQAKKRSRRRKSNNTGEGVGDIEGQREQACGSQGAGEREEQREQACGSQGAGEREAQMGQQGGGESMDLDELVVLEGEEACAEGEQIQGSREAAAAQTHTNPEQLQGPGVAATDTIASTGRHKRKGRSKGGVSNKGDGLLRADMVRDVYQWLGALCCGLSGPSCTALLPPHIQRYPGSQRVSVQQWSGLVTFRQVLQQFNEALRLVAAKLTPWAAVTLRGWQDSPIAWVGQEHSSRYAMGLAGSASCYVLLVMERDVLVLRGLGAGETPQPC